ncbi:uncharacterized protein [Panulirus ornatus]
MLNNPDMVKRARKLLSKRVTGSAKGAAGARPGGAKATAKSTKVSGLSSKASGSKAGTAGNKLGTSSTSSKLTSSSHISASDTSSSSYKIPTSSAMSTKHVGSNLNSQGSSTSTQTSTKSNSSKIKYMGQDVNSGVQVFDLPEDPDYSLLKRSISASANGVANIARLLVTGTEEVRNIILNECDMILECKVCHNLFRSVVNFLAHKRIYCQEEFADVRTLFHKDDVQGITSHSSTVIVEPEPPPDIDPHPSTSSAPEILTKTARTAMQGNSSSSGIDSIAAKLASRKKHSITSHASHTGSSKYFERLDCVSSLRDKLSRDCSVVLEDIAGVTNARYQTFVSPTINAPTVSMNAIVDEVSKRSAGLTVAINEHGEIMKTAPGNVRTMDVEQSMVGSGMSKELICRTCNTRFATQKTLSVHQRSHHGFERCIYCCPICKSTFLSMWAVVKHLQRYHKKTKSQTERLRKVIKKNVYKKMVYHSEDRHGEYREMDIYRKEGDSLLKENQIVEEEGTALEENSTNNQSTKREIQGLHRSTVLTSPRKCSPTKSPLKGWRSKEGVRWMCNVCLKMFITRAASLAHVATHIICNFEPRAILVNVETGKHVRKNRRSTMGAFKSSLDTSDSESEMEEENEEQYDIFKEEQPQEVEELKEIVIEEPPLKSGRKNKESVRQIVVDSVSDFTGRYTENSDYENYSNSVLREQSENLSENNAKEMKISFSPLSSVERERFEPLSSIDSDSSKITTESDFRNRNKTSSSWDNLVSASGTSDKHENKSDSENSKEGSPMKKLTQNQLATPTRVPIGSILSPEDIDVDLESVLVSSLNFASIPYPESRYSGASPVKSCWESQSQEDVHKAATELHLFEENWSGSGSSSESEDEKEHELRTISVASEQMDIDSEPEAEGSVELEGESIFSEDCLTKVTPEVGQLECSVSHEKPGMQKHISSLEVTKGEDLKIVKSDASQQSLSTRDPKKDKSVVRETSSKEAVIIVGEDRLETGSKVLVDEMKLKEEIINSETIVKEEIKEEISMTEVVSNNSMEQCIKQEILIKEEKEITELANGSKEKIKQSHHEEHSETQLSEEWIDHIALIDSTLADHPENEKGVNEPRKDSSFIISSGKAEKYEIVIYSPVKEIKDENVTVSQTREKMESQSVHFDEDTSTQSFIHCKDFTQAEGTVGSLNLPKCPPSVNLSKSSKLIAEASSFKDSCTKLSISCTESKLPTENSIQTEVYASSLNKLGKTLDSELSSVAEPESSVASLSKPNTCTISTNMSGSTGSSDVQLKTVLASVSQQKASCITHPRTSSFENKPSTALIIKSKVSMSSTSLPKLSAGVTQSDILVASVTQPGSSASATEAKASVSPVSQLKLPQICTASVIQPLTFTPKEISLKTKALSETIPGNMAEDTIVSATSVSEQDSSLAMKTSNNITPVVTQPKMSASVTYTEADTDIEMPVLSDCSSSAFISQNTVISSSAMEIKPSAALDSLVHTYDSGITVTEPKTTVASIFQSNAATSTLTETKPGLSLSHQKSTTSSVTQPKPAVACDTQSRTATVCVTQPRTAITSVPQARISTAVTQPKITTASLTLLRTTTASETQHRITTTSVTQPRTTTVSVTQPRTTIAVVPQLRIATASVTQPTQPRTTSASGTQPKTTIVSLTQPRTTVASVTRLRTSTDFVTKPRFTTTVTQPITTAVSVIKPRITVTSVAQSRTTIASLIQPKYTSPSVTQNRTIIASVSQPGSSTSIGTQPEIINASVNKPRINTASEPHPRTTTTSATQPKNSSVSMTQTQTTTVSLTPNKTVTSVIQPKTSEPKITVNAKVENVTQSCMSDVTVTQTKNSSDSLPKNSCMPGHKSKGPTGYLTICNVTTSQVGYAEDLACCVAETETAEARLKNLFGEVSDENDARSVVQNNSPSCSSIYSKVSFDHAETVDNAVDQSKCTTDCYDQNTASTSTVLSRNTQNPVTYSKDHTSNLEVSQYMDDKKERGEMREKSKQVEEERIADYLGMELNKRVNTGYDIDKMIMSEIDEANKKELKNSECKGFNESHDENEGEIDFRKTQNTASIVEELKEPCDDQKPLCIDDTHNIQDSFKQSELESPQSTLSLPDLCRINTSSSKVFVTKLENKNCGSDIGLSCPKEAVGLDDDIHGDLVMQQPNHSSKHLYMNSKKKNIISGVTKKSSPNLNPFHIMNIDRSYSTEWKEREANLKKSYDSTTAVEQSNLKKRDRESCEDGHSNLVTEILGIDTNIVKKSRSSETPITQKVVGTDEVCSKDGEIMCGRDGYALEKQSSSCSETKGPEVEEDILQKVKDDWAQLSAAPQWKWRKREKNKELWKLVMAAKATVNSKKLSQKKDCSKSLPDTYKCGTSSDMDENLKESESSEAMENVDQEMSEPKFARLTAVQYLKGKKWNEECILQKRTKITNELSGYTLTDDKEETVVQSNDVDLSKGALDEIVAMSPRKDSRQEEEDKTISTSCPESQRRFSPSLQNKVLDNVVILEDSSTLDPHITAVLDDGTTLDETAVMRDPTTFGDLSYYYDLH